MWFKKLSPMLARREVAFWTRDAGWLVVTDGHILVSVITDEVLDGGRRDDERGRGAAEIRKQVETFSAEKITTLGELRAWLEEPSEEKVCATCSGARRERCRNCRGMGTITCVCDDCENEHSAECDCDGGYRACGACFPSTYPPEIGQVGKARFNRRLLRGFLPPIADDATVVEVRPSTSKTSPFFLRAGPWLAAVMPMQSDDAGPALPMRAAAASSEAAR